MRVALVRLPGREVLATVEMKERRVLLGRSTPLYSHWTEGGGKPKASHTKLPILDVFRVTYWGLKHDPWRNLVMVGGAGVEGLCREEELRMVN